MRIALFPSLFATLLLAGCAETSVVQSVPPGTFSGQHARSVYVPRLVANADWASAVSMAFVDELSAKTKGRVTVVPGEPVTNAPLGEAARLPAAEAAFGGQGDTGPTMSDAGLVSARRVGAGLLALGDVSTHQGPGGYVAEATVQVVAVSAGTTLFRLRQEAGAPDERQAALAATVRAADALAGGF